MIINADIDQMDAKEMLKKYHALKATLDNYNLEIECGTADQETKDKATALKLRLGKLENAVKALPENQRRAVELRFFERLKTEQISMRTYYSVGGVFRLLSKAYKSIDEFLSIAATK